MKLPSLFQPRILKLALKSLFGRPFTDKVPDANYMPIPQYRGRPRYSREGCIGCGACSIVCPTGCIDMIDDTKASPPVRRLVQHFDVCIQCGQCERYCTSEKGIKLTNEYDFVGFKPEDFEEKMDKELLLCESCGCAITPIDHIRWLVKRLGALAFANPTMMLMSHKELAVVDEGIKTQAGKAVRGRHMSIQCPKCRRQTALVI